MARKIAIWFALTVIAAVVVFAGLRGCTAMPWNRNRGSSGTVRIAVTRDYGGAKVKEGRVPIPDGASVMEALRSFAGVETEYGGGFVSRIEGIASTKGSSRSDWFYYLNGIMPAAGAQDVRVTPGDRVWWDYREWHGDGYAPAAVGAYPAPFTRGPGGAKPEAKVFYAPGMAAPAEAVGAFLAGRGADVDVAALTSNALSRPEGPTMAFMTCGQAISTEGVSAMLDPRRGAFVAIEGDGLVALDAGGRPAPSAKPLACAVVSTAKGMGDEAPVWFVLCARVEDAGLAEKLLTSGRGGLRDRIGAVVDRTGKVSRVPR